MFLDLKIRGPALPFPEISDPFLCLLPVFPGASCSAGGLEDAAEQRGPFSLQPPQRSHPLCVVPLRPAPPPLLFSNQPVLHRPPSRPQRTPAPSSPGGGSVLKSPYLAPARGVRKLRLPRPDRQTRWVSSVAGETRDPGEDSHFSSPCPLRYPLPAAFTQRRGNSASA